MMMRTGLGPLGTLSVAVRCVLGSWCDIPTPSPAGKRPSDAMRLARALHASRALLHPSQSSGQFPARLGNYGDIMVSEAMHALFSELTVIECSQTLLARALDRTIGLHHVFRYSSLAGGTLILGGPQTGW